MLALYNFSSSSITMKLRTTQLVSLALLLATLSYAGSPALAATGLPSQLQRQVTYLRVLGDYGKMWSATARETQQARSGSFKITVAPRSTRSFTISAADLAVIETPWMMRPPSAQYASLQAFTASSRPAA